jgi:hypoxia up-regulated 1
LLAASKAKLVQMAARDKERMMLEEAKNNVESYIYRIKNKLEDESDILSKVSTEEQREACRKLAVEAEAWMEDEGYAADLATTKDKYVELSEPFERILRRVSELEDRPAAVKALQKKLDEIEQLMSKWETKLPYITEEEKAPVLTKIKDIRKWIADKEAEQASKQPHEDPVYVSQDVAVQSKPLETLVVRLSRKPKPKPLKKNETKVGNATDTNSTNATESVTFDLKANKSANDTAEDSATNDAERKNDTDGVFKDSVKDDAEEKAGNLDTNDKQQVGNDTATEKPVDKSTDVLDEEEEL